LAATIEDKERRGVVTSEFVRMLHCASLYVGDSKALQTLKGLPGTQLIQGRLGPYYMATDDAVWKHLLSYSHVTNRFKRKKITNMQEFRDYMVEWEENNKMSRAMVERYNRNDRLNDEDYK
jgi:hypothetical protein